MSERRGSPPDRLESHYDDVDPRRSETLADFISKMSQLRRADDSDATWVLLEDLGRQVSSMRHRYLGFKTVIDAILFGDPTRGFESQLVQIDTRIVEVKKEITNELAPVKRQVNLLYRGLAVAGGILVVGLGGYLTVLLAHIHFGSP